MAIGDGLTALVLEDDPQIQALISKVLTAHGFKIHTASNGLEGLVSLEASLPDIILCDLMMPELDGLGFAQAIKRSSRGRAVPIIFVTARDDVTSMVDGMKAGAVWYLTKPFKRDDLLAAIKLALAARISSG